MNIFWIVTLLSIGYIGFDLWKSRDKLKKEKMINSFKNYKKGLEEATIKDYITATIIFILVFMIAKGLFIAQNEMQECQVWITQEGYNYLINSNIKYDIKDYINLEQNRSYTFYKKFFEKTGGRLNVVNINCNLKISIERFKKNIILDYNERNKEW